MGSSCESGLREIDTEPVVDSLGQAGEDGELIIKPGYEYTPERDRALPAAYIFAGNFLFQQKTDGKNGKFPPLLHGK